MRFIEWTVKKPHKENPEKNVADAFLFLSEPICVPLDFVW